MRRCIAFRPKVTESEKMKKIKESLSAFGQSISLTFRACGHYAILRLLFSFLLACLPFVSASIWRNVLNELSESNHVWKQLAVFVIFWGMSQLIRKIDGFIDYKYNDRVNLYLETVFLDKYKDIDLSFYDSGETQNKLQHVQNIKNSVVGLSSNLFSVLEYLIRMIWAFVLLTQLNFWVGPVSVLLFLPVILCQIKTNQITIKYDKESAAISRRSQYFKLLFRNRKNISDIKVYGLHELFIRRFSDAWNALYKSNKKRIGITVILIFVGLIFSTVLGQVLLFGLLIRNLLTGTLLIGDVSFFIAVFASFIAAADSFTHGVSYIQYMLENTKIVREFLALEPSVQRSGDKKPLFEHEIEFRHVSFKYPGTENYVLQDCSFRIEKGETVGLVGLNGAGKTTIVKLLLRLYDVNDGMILLDGADIREIELTAYRKQFGVLFQDYMPYSLTLRENIALSDWNERENDTAVIRALTRSKMLEKVNTWTNGLDTPLTRRFEPDGEELSGGQWQRLALARAFFRPKSFYILDEPSSSLDAIAEYEIFHQYSGSWTDCGALIISHRLSTIADADKILFLQGGKIIEQGTHKELLEEDGQYADLYLTQAKKYED